MAMTRPGMNLEKVVDQARQRGSPGSRSPGATRAVGARFP